jgi:hypothetical protein
MPDGPFFDFELPPRKDADLLFWDHVAGEWVTRIEWIFRCSRRAQRRKEQSLRSGDKH